MVEVVQLTAKSTYKPSVIYIADYSNGADVILGQKELSSIKDLKDRTIGVESGSLSIFFLMQALNSEGMNIDDVKMVSLDQSNMFDAFKDGSLDAVVTYPPVSIEIINKLESNQLYSSRQIPGKIIDVLSAEQSVINDKESQIRNFVKAYSMAQTWFDSNVDKAVEIMSGRCGISPENFKESILNELQVMKAHDQKNFFDNKVGLDNAIKEVIDAMVKSGELRNTPGLELISHEMVFDPSAISSL